MPDRVGLGRAGLHRHKGFWRFAFTCGDLLHRASRRDRSVLVEDIVGLAFFGKIVAMLDQQPVGPLAAIAVVAHAHQHPTAMKLVAMQRKFQIALLEAPLRVVGFPIAAVPELHGAAAILVLWNGAFEIAVVQWMIFHLHRQPLVMRIQRGAARDRPGLEDAVELQPEIVVQPAGVMLLDHEPSLLRRRYLALPAWFRGLFEIALFSVGGEVSQRHDQIPRQMKKQPAAVRQQGPEPKPPAVIESSRIPPTHNKPEIVMAVRAHWKGSLKLSLVSCLIFALSGLDQAPRIVPPRRRITRSHKAG